MKPKHQRFWTIPLLVIMLASAAVVVVGLLRQNAKPKSMHPKFTQNDFPQYGVVILNPSNPRFDSASAAMLEGKEIELNKLLVSARPFSVFVENLTDISIVGCNLEWRIEQSDGTVINRSQSYVTPGPLMGMEPIDKNMIGHTDLINPHSIAFISLDPETKQIFDWRTRSIVPLSPLDVNSKPRIQELRLQFRRLNDHLVASAKRITVSIDAAIFADGSFFGPDNNGLITATKSMVDAKRDLSKSIEAELQHNKRPKDVFRRIESMARTSLLPMGHGKSLDEKYLNSYEREMEVYIQELVRIREAKGDAAAIKYSQEPLRRLWPTLRPKLTK
ncbi:MAG: hypothetical protein AABN95_20535 [Acidobacteriota bacterium]